jgi:uracil phosphoribosyltransferase
MASSGQAPVSPKQSVGPDYRSEKQKPIATVSTEVPFENVHTLPQTPQLIALLTWVKPKPVGFLPC